MSHSDDCEDSGYGSEGFGEDGYGGGLTLDPGILPIEPPFDIYCFCVCGALASFFSYEAISQDGDGSQFVYDSYTDSMLVGSGGDLPITDAVIIVDTAVPDPFTLETELFFKELPDDFSDVHTKHVYLGAFNAQGASVGILISKEGLLYTGSAHYDGTSIVLDGPTQGLAGSAGLVDLETYYTVRIAVNAETGVVYIYWTLSSDVDEIGHQLRYVLPALQSSTMAVVPPDSTFLSVRGTVEEKSLIAFDCLCLGTGLLIPNIPPVADAGTDQAVRSCSIVQFDGGRSFDPEGVAITYQWRLIDAPLGSQYIFDGLDGHTIRLVSHTGFTDKLHSVDLAAQDALEPILVNDVIVVRGSPFSITGKGTDSDGFYVSVFPQIEDDL